MIGLLRIDAAELQNAKIQLDRGMPSAVMIPRTERKAFEYHVCALIMSLKTWVSAEVAEAMKEALP